MFKQIPWVLILVSAFSFAQLPANTNSSGVFIDGYDVTAYFTQGRAVQGVSAHQVQWQELTLYFQTENNKSLFLQSPETYIPEYFGHCANGLSDGHLVPGNPKIFRIIEGRLYLFFSWWGKAQWKYDQQAQIELANENWLRFTE